MVSTPTEIPRRVSEADVKLNESSPAPQAKPKAKPRPKAKRKSEPASTDNPAKKAKVEKEVKSEAVVQGGPEDVKAEAGSDVKMEEPVHSTANSGTRDQEAVPQVVVKPDLGALPTALPVNDSAEGVKSEAKDEPMS
jgi:hypothetical protein